jgi:hypothetical protein
MSYRIGTWLAERRCPYTDPESRRRWIRGFVDAFGSDLSWCACAIALLMVVAIWVPIVGRAIWP